MEQFRRIITVTAAVGVAGLLLRLAGLRMVRIQGEKSDRKEYLLTFPFGNGVKITVKLTNGKGTLSALAEALRQFPRFRRICRVERLIGGADRPTAVFVAGKMSKKVKNRK